LSQPIQPPQPPEEPVEEPVTTKISSAAKRRASRRSVSFADHIHRELAHRNDFDDNGFGGYGGFDDYDDNDNNRYRSNRTSMSDRSFDTIAAETFGTVMQSYEDLCRKHLDTYVRSTEQYMQDARLVYRVQDWQQKLSPFLDQQSRRKQFDIQDYSESVLSHFPDNDDDDDEEEDEIIQDEETTDHEEQEILDFKQISNSRAPFEVCRLFIATLQLANSGNVEIQSESSNPESFTVKLLSKDFKHEDLEQWTPTP
jgi:hypothetical protein